MDEFILINLSKLTTVMLIGIIFLSLYILGKGADYLVDNSIELSLAWGIPEVIVGATIISLGTTIPEVTVSVMASLKSSGDLALGNAIGSIITNTSLILGASALLGSLKISKIILEKQGRFLLFVSYLLAGLSLPMLGDGEMGIIGKKTGILFLLLLSFYLYRSMKESNVGEVEKLEVEDNIITYIVKILLGIFVVILSSKVLIPSVQLMAIRVGIPESIISATLVAFGTSVPEMMTALTSVKKGHGELAIGNIIGANILNVLFVIGLSALVSPAGLMVPKLYFNLQIPVMLFSVTLLHILSSREKGALDRKEGLVLLLVYSSYLLLNFV